MYLFCKKRNRFKAVITLVIASFLCPAAHGQREVNERTGWSLKDRLYFGGGLDLGGASNYFIIGLNPIVGYMITPRLSAGVGVTWLHLSFPNSRVEINQYGGNIFARYGIIKMLFAYGEYGFLNTPITLRSEGRVIVSRLPLGLGYAQPLGRRGAINALALYDVLYRKNSYNFASSPWVFRVYFTY